MSPLAAEHYQAQLRQEEAAAILARRQWRAMSSADLDGSWAQIVNRLTLMVSAAQLGAARAGALYVAQAVAVNPDAEVRPEAWAGVASDGRPLDSLLYASVVHTKERLAAGIGAVEALGAGQAWLDMLVRTQVADASRGAAGVAVTARPHVGYVRVVSPPCCKRCAVLAGKFFKWNQGFLRHPRCDCRHEPLEEGHPAPRPGIDPGQVRDLTVSQRQAIADGADLNQVINSDRKRARSGMTTAEGTTRRGLAGQRGVRQRLTPDGIYRLSSSREQALDLLKRHGYLL